MAMKTGTGEFETKVPGDSSYLDEVWDLKEKIRKQEGYLCQTWNFFSDAYVQNTGYLYFDDGELVGFLTVRDDGYILFLGIEPEYRGRGIGRLLIEKVESEYDKITCHARESNENAISFYQHLDFEVESHINSYYQNGDSAYYLVKRVGNDDSASWKDRLSEVISGEE
ncbi:MAG: N-acetyltransferase [Halobacteria archaeon]|nr:N-acetyltransferase [Halobacteria archaeon]